MKIKKMLLTISSVILFLSASVAQAQSNYVQLSRELPLIGTNVGGGVPTFLNNLLGISVGFAAILAVIVLSIGGFKYMTSESVFNMGSAKEQITNAVVGLIIVLAAILILGYINPDIITMRFFTT